MPKPANRSCGHWLIVDTDDVQSTVDEWASVLGGPMHDWLIERNSEGQLLDTVAAAPHRVERHPFATRSIAPIALCIDRVDLARLFIAQYERGMDDTPNGIESAAARTRDCACWRPQSSRWRRRAGPVVPVPVHRMRCLLDQPRLTSVSTAPPTG